MKAKVVAVASIAVSLVVHAVSGAIGSDDSNLSEQGIAEVLRVNASTNCVVSACAVVYRVGSGELLASANVGEMSADYAYEPGAVVMPLTAIAAFENGVAKIDTLYSTDRKDQRYYALPSDGAHVWPGKMSIGDSIVKSSNIVLGKLGYDVGPTNLLASFAALGLGSRGGRLPRCDRMDRASRSRVAIGQGLHATPDEIARAYVILANRGKSPWTGCQVVEQASADSVVKVLCRVVSEGGTARRAAVEGTTVAGKTGTAQRIIDKKYVRLYNSTFVGMFPADKPEYVVAVVYQTDPKGDPLYQGGGHAALAFSQIASGLVK